MRFSLKRRFRYPRPDPNGRYSSSKAEIQTDLVIRPTLEAESSPRMMGLSGLIEKLDTFLMRYYNIIMPTLIGLLCVLLPMLCRQSEEICRERQKILAALNNPDFEVGFMNSANQFIGFKNILELKELVNVDQLNLSSNMSVCDEVIHKLKQLVLDGKLKLCVVKKSLSNVKDMELGDGDVMLLGYSKTDGGEKKKNESLQKPEGHGRDLLHSQFVSFYDTRM